MCFWNKSDKVYLVCFCSHIWEQVQKNGFLSYKTGQMMHLCAPSTHTHPVCGHWSQIFWSRSPRTSVVWMLDPQRCVSHCGCFLYLTTADSAKCQYSVFSSLVGIERGNLQSYTHTHTYIYKYFFIMIAGCILNLEFGSWAWFCHRREARWMRGSQRSSTWKTDTAKTEEYNPGKG